MGVTPPSLPVKVSSCLICPTSVCSGCFTPEQCAACFSKPAEFRCPLPRRFLRNRAGSRCGRLGLWNEQGQAVGWVFQLCVSLWNLPCQQAILTALQGSALSPMHLLSGLLTLLTHPERPRGLCHVTWCRNDASHWRS